MPAALSANPWTASTAARRDGGWQFARELAPAGGWRFEMRRDGVAAPRRPGGLAGRWYALALLAAAGVWLQGIALAGLLAAALLLGLLVFAARRAGDHELITLSGRELAVEQHCGSAVARTAFRTEWVRVEPLCDDGSLVELSGEGRSVRVGRHVRPELRVALAQELRRALRLARTAGDRFVDHELEAPK